MKTYFFVIFMRLLCEILSVRAGNTAFCLLTIQPPLETLEFIEQLAQDGMQYGVDVYMLIDNDNFTLPSRNTSLHFKILKISVQECVAHNYHHTTHYGQNKSYVAAWDKALLYFGILNKNYSFIWFTENDVFIPSTQAFRSLHQLYSNTSDLVIPSNTLNLDGNATYWQWSEAVGKHVPPWANSMVNFVGLSQRLLQALDENIRWRGSSSFHEYFFLTIAMKSNLTIVTPLELNTITHRKYVDWDSVYNRPNNIWHPMKDQSRRSLNRIKLAEANLQRQDFDYAADLKALHDDVENIPHLVENLENFLAKFEINKGRLSAKDRRSMRQDFISLADYYQHLQNSEQAILLAQQLADHAYKLPEAQLKLWAPNSSLYLKLEEELLVNKRTVLKIVSTKSGLPLLVNLRYEAMVIMRKLTLEFQREAIEKRKRENLDPMTIFFISSSGYKYNIKIEQKSTYSLLCIQLLPCLSIIILLLMAKKLSRFHWR